MSYFHSSANIRKNRNQIKEFGRPKVWMVFPHISSQNIGRYLVGRCVGLLKLFSFGLNDK